MSFDEILTAAQSLPAVDRFRLIDALIIDLPEESAVISPEWWAEIDRRVQEAAEGKTRFFSWEEVRKRAYEAAGIENAS